MSELIPIKPATIGGEEINAVNARDLYAALGIKKDFSNWVKAQIERAGFVEGIDYLKIAEKSSSPKKASGIQGRIDYFFTIPAAKEICMMAQTPKGKEVRLYFIECRKRSRYVFSCKFTCCSKLEAMAGWPSFPFSPALSFCLVCLLSHGQGSCHALPGFLFFREGGNALYCLRQCVR